MSIDQNNKHDRVRVLAKAYYIAKKSLMEEGFAPEIDWQYDISISRLDETTFLKESSWVILCSGMSEKVVRKVFPDISRSFFHWCSAHKINSKSYICREKALRHFGHASKIDSILLISSYTAKKGFEYVKRRIKDEGVDFLSEFPYIGPVTSYHLAKNIGLSVSKPDRHLCRIASQLGYDSPQGLCSDIAARTDEPVSVVDLVLWRYATVHSNYIQRFAASLE